MPTRDHFRAFARRSVHLNALVGSVDGGWEEPARVTDLGLGGACVEMREAVSPGTQVRVELNAPHLWDPLRLQAAIAWSQDDASDGAARVGIRFENNTGKTLRWLVELLEAQQYD